MDIVVRSNRAKALLSDPTYQELVEELRKEQISVFLNSGSNPEGREEAHNICCALAKIEARLQSYVTDEKLLNKTKGQHRGND